MLVTDGVEAQVRVDAFEGLPQHDRLRRLDDQSVFWPSQTGSIKTEVEFGLIAGKSAVRGGEKDVKVSVGVCGSDVLDTVTAAAGLVHDLDSGSAGAGLDLAHERSHAPEATHPELLVHTLNHEPAGHSLTHHKSQTRWRNSGQTGRTCPGSRLGQGTPVRSRRYPCSP
nr:hypothetical protein [Brevibacterium sp. Mu109]